MNNKFNKLDLKDQILLLDKQHPQLTKKASVHVQDSTINSNVTENDNEARFLTTQVLSPETKKDPVEVPPVMPKRPRVRKEGSKEST